MRYKVNIKLGKKVAKIRKAQKITQEELAGRIGVHYTTLSRIERGESNPPIYTVFKISQALKTPLKELFS